VLNGTQGTQGATVKSEASMILGLYDGIPRGASPEAAMQTRWGELSSTPSEKKLQRIDTHQESVQMPPRLSLHRLGY
jgi:hypothetical protein